MRKVAKVGIALTFVLIILLVSLPYFLGILFERQYKQFIVFYNTQNALHIEIKHYQRGWFTSHVKLETSFENPALYKLSQLLSQTGQGLPKQTNISINQRVVHGPIILRESQPLVTLGLAFINSRLQLSSTASQYVQAVDKTKPLFQFYHSVTLAGNFWQVFEMQAANIIFPDRNTNIKIQGMTSRLLIEPGHKRIAGSFIINKIEMSTGNVFVSSPNFIFKIDEYLENGLWFGRNEFNVPELNVTDASGKSMGLSGLGHISSLSPEGNNVNAERSITISKMHFSESNFGPFKLKLNLESLNRDGVQAFTAMFHDLLEEQMSVREIYQGIILNSIKLINPGTQVIVKQFILGTPDGNLDLSGAASWARDLNVMPKNLYDIAHLAKANVSIVISEPLANEIAGMIIDLFYINRGPNPNMDADLFKKLVASEKQQSLMLVGVLMQDNQVSRNAGNILLNLQNADVSREEYTAALDSLKLNKQISANAADMLANQYTDVKYPAMTLDERHAVYVEKFQNNVNKWLDLGYLHKNSSDVLQTNLLFQKGSLQANGRAVAF